MQTPVRLTHVQIQQWMLYAMQVAEKALPLDVPVGAILLDSSGECVAEGFNTRERDGDILGHAELNAVKQATALVSNWRLTTHTLIVTLEPCAMCREVLIQSRIGQVIFGAFDTHALSHHSEGISFIQRMREGLPDTRVLGGILEDENHTLLKRYFQAKRSSTPLL